MFARNLHYLDVGIFNHILSGRISMNMIETAKELGFSGAAVIDTAQLVFYTGVSGLL